MSEVHVWKNWKKRCVIPGAKFPKFLQLLEAVANFPCFIERLLWDWMNGNKPNLKNTHLDFMKWTVFSPHHTNHFVVSRSGVNEKNKWGPIRGHCRLCGDASGFFLSHLATLTPLHDWTFWIRGGCKLSIWGDIYIYIKLYKYHISYPSLGGFFLRGKN